jgi:hypothetical protein
MNTRRLSRPLLVGLVAALVAVPVSQAASGNLVQIDGKLVAPAQVSAAQIAAGHSPSTRLVQIGGSLVEPQQLSAWQARVTLPVAPTVTTDESSSGFGTGAIAAIAALGGLMLLAASTLIVRHRRGLAPA